LNPQTYNDECRGSIESMSPDDRINLQNSFTVKQTNAVCPHDSFVTRLGHFIQRRCHSFIELVGADKTEQFSNK
jgi:hypothetical protein